ncbi:MAG: transcription elongation factor GreA [Solirubrobacterales bacterium]|nr:transcription elongation factor GreA [Solirubrobacterales bacterium]
MSDTTKLTPAAHQKITDQIERLEGEGRREVAARIKTAREWGDLKENAEYHAAKEDAAMLEAKINGLRDQLRSAEIVEAADDGVAGMGSRVTYTDEATGKELAHTLVPKIEADPGNGRISIDSPVGQALVGKRAGEAATLETPSGTRTMRVVAVELA